MMKFEFIRMQEPDAPSWDHADPAWRLDELPGLDLSAVWRRHWNWLRGASVQDEPVNRIDTAEPRATPIRAGVSLPSTISRSAPRRRARACKRSPRCCATRWNQSQSMPPMRWPVPEPTRCRCC